VAVWDQDPLLAAEEFGVPLVDTPDLAGLISAASAKVVIIAFGRRRESEMVAVLRTCDRMDCEIFVVPRLFELHMWGSDTDEVWGMPLVRLRRPAYRLPSWQLKHVFDVIVALAMLIPLAPLMAALALAVRLEGGKGVIFRQQRVGLNGKVFNVLKFRSMRPANDEEAAIKWSVSQDSRVGPVGRFLRRTSLDELPQLWNVLRRDMTLVGPRPERPFFVEQFSRQFPRYQARQRVPPGLTGWAQVNGLRGDTSIYDRAAFDNYYIENWSLWLDVKILLRTIVAVLRRDGC
jgi:exopolysaccharide biosynthesis polyprenyl glycosylphosphotransferase